MLRLGHRQGKGNRFVVGVQQQKERIADDGLAALVDVADQVAGQAHAQAFDEAGVPGFVGHVLARWARTRKYP